MTVTSNDKNSLEQRLSSAIFMAIHGGLQDFRDEISRVANGDNCIQHKIHHLVMDAIDAHLRIVPVISGLLDEQRQDREMIRILWERGKFSQSVGNALSEDGVIKRAFAVHPEVPRG